MIQPINISHLTIANRSAGANRSWRIGNPFGFSLVEIMVSAAIISIMLVAIVAMVRKGQEFIPLNRHMQFARGIIARTLEQEAYQPENYNNIASGTITETVILDPKTNLQGTFTMTISAQLAQVQGVAIPHKEITAVINWLEPGTPPVTQTVRIVKWVTYLQH